jgi:hypothetical protein
MKTVLMFSGQGSQYYHMGRRLFDNNRAFKGHMTRLNDVAASVLGISVIGALYDDRRTKAEPFSRAISRLITPFGGTRRSRDPLSEGFRSFWNRHGARWRSVAVWRWNFQERSSKIKDLCQKSDFLPLYGQNINLGAPPRGSRNPR